MWGWTWRRPPQFDSATIYHGGKQRLMHNKRQARGAADHNSPTLPHSSEEPSGWHLGLSRLTRGGRTTVAWSRGSGTKISNKFLIAACGGQSEVVYSGSKVEWSPQAYHVISPKLRTPFAVIHVKPIYPSPQMRNLVNA